MITAEQLAAFSADIAAEFNAAKIRAPIHLDGGNENKLLSYFQKNWRPGDWTCCTWRSHFKALLASVPPAELKAEIMEGRSIFICMAKYRVVSSAIVGGILPIALGIAWGIVRNSTTERVHVFVGDMAARGGMFHECYRYALGHGLPINFIVEDNGKSVGTPTAHVWNPAEKPANRSPRIYSITYDLPWPHSGAGKRVDF